MVDEPMVPLSQLSAAVDEIYALRRALAREAGGLEAHLTYKTFPKSRRSIAEQQVERMRASARGEVRRAYAGTPHYVLDSAMKDAGAKDTLTNQSWLEASGWTEI